MKAPLLAAGAGALLLAGPALASPTHSLLDLLNADQAPAQDAPKPEAKKEDGSAISAKWKNGFWLETADKQFTMRISGRFQLDTAFFSGDDSDIGLNFSDGGEVRRTYLAVGGKLWGDIDYQLEWDLAAASNKIMDSFIGFATPAGAVKLGHFKQPFSLEELTSDLHTSFMERSLSSAFGLGRDIGVQLSGNAHDESVNWAVGVYRDAGDNGDSTSANNDANDAYAFTGRLAWAPWYEEEGAKLFHVGAAASLRNPKGSSTKFETKPESNLAPKVLSLTLAADDFALYGIELATVLGAFSAQAEYMLAKPDLATGSDPDLTGYYVYATYFLTGEHRNYKKAGGVFDRIKPKSNFSPKNGGTGAWEVGLRYSVLDFGDALTSGDLTLEDITAGVSWYWNPNLKMQLNVIQSSFDDDTPPGGGDMLITELRFQADL